MTATAQSYLPTSYSLDTLKDEARQLIETGVISPQQSIYTLCKYIPAREWVTIECQLERADYLLRDPIGDLVSYDNWEND
ncbi:MAG: DUF4327 family protein [Pleurocapsa sp. SU_5_0]|nr:DUF4327 family protein [Pleurocapsa sp. SU_5_0]NJO97940.1 DUF4327 family protein [Pleurocapsa sp. CRU_1_2]NJR47429.1 DUF4327 family protein [Hyellaceae cyanobacterium CSU_1_1]